MSKTIWKYMLTPDCTHNIPEDSKILDLNMQDGAPHLWVLVDPKKPLIKRRFVGYGTGEEMNDNHRVYVGTFQLLSGRLIHYVFEEDIYE